MAWIPLRFGWVNSENEQLTPSESSEIVVHVAETMHKQAAEQIQEYNEKGRNSSGVILEIKIVQQPAEPQTHEKCTRYVSPA